MIPSIRDPFSDLRKLAEKILYFWANELQYFTDHGPEHSERVADYLTRMIVQNSSQVTFNDEEVFLLYLSAWYHDIGNLCGRENHHIRSRNFIRGSWGRTWLGNYLNRQELSVLGILCYAHGADPSSVYPRETIMDGHPVRLRTLGALLRLADACDSDCRKSPDEPFDLLKSCDRPIQQGIEHWESHQAIQKVDFDEQGGLIVIYVDIHGMPEEAKLAVEHICEDFSVVRSVLVQAGFPYQKAVIREGNLPLKDCSEWLRGL